MKIAERIKSLIALYAKQKDKPQAMILCDGDLEELDVLANAQRQTWFTVGQGYFGRGKTLLESAMNCKRAGADTKDPVVCLLVVGDDDAVFVSIFCLEYKAGSTVVRVGSFKSLRNVLAIKPVKE